MTQPVPEPTGSTAPRRAVNVILHTKGNATPEYEFLRLTTVMFFAAMTVAPAFGILFICAAYHRPNPTPTPATSQHQQG